MNILTVINGGTSNTTGQNKSDADQKRSADTKS